MASNTKRTGVMLAYPADEKRMAKMPAKVFFQRKLNGERARLVWVGNRPVLLTSLGNEIPFLLDMLAEIKEKVPVGTCFDGELYNHQLSREEIHSICSRRTNPHGNERNLKFHVFDIVDHYITQNNRIEFLEDFFGMKSFKYLQKVQTFYSHKENLIQLANTFINEGYEGVIIRNPHELYTPRKCNHMLKFKPTAQDSYVITGYQEEIDIRGFAKGSLGSVEVIDSDGKVFSVGTGKALTAETRKELWKNPDKLIGMTAVVKHSTINTVNGFPTCTSLISLEINNSTPD